MTVSVHAECLLSLPHLRGKSGDQEMDWAQSQNMGSGSVAVAAILELYKAASVPSEPQRVEDLYGQVLAFSVSHDHKHVSL